jgi:rhodanese-related sulfurtransferase
VTTRTEESRELARACRTYLKQIPENLNYVTPAELQTILQKDPDSVFVLDNRTPDAYRAGHIPGAVNIWLKDVLDEENVALLPTDRRIVVCCWVGHTASQLTAILRLLGYDAVGLKYGMGKARSAQEAIAGWTTCGMPLKEGDAP